MSENNNQRKTWIMYKKVNKTKYIDFTTCPWSTNKWTDMTLERPTTYSHSESEWGTFDASIYVGYMSNNNKGAACFLNKTSTYKLLMHYSTGKEIIPITVTCPPTARICPKNICVSLTEHSNRVSYFVYGINEDDTVELLGSKGYSSAGSGSGTINYSINTDKYYKGFKIDCKPNYSSQYLTFKSFEVTEGTLKID